MSEKVGLKVRMLTKKVKGKRVMRSLPVWRCLNKTTPFSWFEKYERFFTELSYELGFNEIEITEVEAIGDNLYFTMVFRHGDRKGFRFTLMRGKQFFGGGVSFRLDKEHTELLPTASVINGVCCESRTVIGDWFIKQIRDHWDLV